MTRTQELISQALKERHRDVCARVSTLEPLSEFATKLKKQFNESHSLVTTWERTDAWLSSDRDCLITLQALALSEPLATGVGGKSSSSEESLHLLLAAARDPKQRFGLLTTRYSFPLNIVNSSEENIREHLLERLMVQDRALIERGGLNSLESDDLLLRLNLISIHAQYSTDLRFLDALNYYYELLPASWYPVSQHAWLLSSFLAIYARALTCSS